jgi:hypothetical protein
MHMRDRMWNPFTEYCPMMNANYKVHLQLPINNNKSFVSFKSMRVAVFLLLVRQTLTHPPPLPGLRTGYVETP